MKRLLLVEDDRSLGATLHERLLREPYDVAWVETKQRALKKLDEGLWDLIILDIGLPDGSGFELARHIKESTAVPIMLMKAIGTKNFQHSDIIWSILTRGSVARTHIEVNTRKRTLTLKLKSCSTFITTGLELSFGACHPPRYRVVMSAPAMNGIAL